MGIPTRNPRCSPFSFAQARLLVADLQRPKPRIYWTDFLLSIIGGHVAFHAMYFMHRLRPEAAWLWPAMALAYVLCVLLYFRSAMFIHELVHLPKQGFRGFRIAWNALCGIFFLIPSFLYYPHVDHHRRKHYGTEHDGEYLELSHRPRWLIVGFILQSLVIPILGVIRFLLISPICWLVPGARAFIHRHASTMVVDPFYRRSDLNRRVQRVVLLQEVLCFAWLSWFFMRSWVRFGEWFDPLWLIAYAVGVGVVTLNGLRTLGAHRWTGTGEPMSFESQLLDSVNYPDKPWLSELWGPVGTRFHALHHLFPALPYHNLGQAHRRLVAGLPSDSLYHFTVAHSLSSELAALWKRASGGWRRQPPIEPRREAA